MYESVRTPGTTPSTKQSFLLEEVPLDREFEVLTFEEFNQHMHMYVASGNLLEYHLDDKIIDQKQLPVSEKVRSLEVYRGLLLIHMANLDLYYLNTTTFGGSLELLTKNVVSFAFKINLENFEICTASRKRLVIFASLVDAVANNKLDFATKHEYMIPAPVKFMSWELSEWLLLGYAREYCVLNTLTNVTKEICSLESLAPHILVVDASEALVLTTSDMGIFIHVPTQEPVIKNPIQFSGGDLLCLRKYPGRSAFFAFYREGIIEIYSSRTQKLQESLQLGQPIKHVSRTGFLILTEVGRVYQLQILPLVSQLQALIESFEVDKALSLVFEESRMEENLAVCLFSGLRPQEELRQGILNFVFQKAGSAYLDRFHAQGELPDLERALDYYSCLPPDLIDIPDLLWVFQKMDRAESKKIGIDFLVNLRYGLLDLRELHDISGFLPSLGVLDLYLLETLLETQDPLVECLLSSEGVKAGGPFEALAFAGPTLETAQLLADQGRSLDLARFYWVRGLFEEAYNLLVELVPQSPQHCVDLLVKTLGQHPEDAKCLCVLSLLLSLNLEDSGVLYQLMQVCSPWVCCQVVEDPLILAAHFQTLKYEALDQGSLMEVLVFHIQDANIPGALRLLEWLSQMPEMPSALNELALKDPPPPWELRVCLHVIFQEYRQALDLLIQHSYFYQAEILCLALDNAPQGPLCFARQEDQADLSDFQFVRLRSPGEDPYLMVAHALVAAQTYEAVSQWLAAYSSRPAFGVTPILDLLPDNLPISLAAPFIQQRLVYRNHLKKDNLVHKALSHAAHSKMYLELVKQRSLSFEVARDTLCQICHKSITSGQRYFAWRASSAPGATLFSHSLCKS